MVCLIVVIISLSQLCFVGGQSLFPSTITIATTAATSSTSSSNSTSTSNISKLLNCSAFGVNSTNTSLQLINWPSRLHECFKSNPYDTTQLPLRPGLASYLPLIYDFSVIYVIDFDDNSIKFVGQITMSWVDYNRIWDVTDVPVYSMHIPFSEIWYPQVLFLSTVTKRSLKVFDPEDLALIINNGKLDQYVVAFKKGVFEGHCIVNDASFPFDTQVCSVDFGIVRYFFSFWDLIMVRSPTSYHFEKFENEEWHLVSYSSLATNTSFQGFEVDSNGGATDVLIVDTKDVQTGFTVKITLKRYPQFYIINLGIPVLVLAVVGQTAFAIPEHADARIVVPLTVLLGFMFIQSIVATYLPNSESPSHVAFYITGCVLLTGCSCIVCTIIMWIAISKSRIPKPLKCAIHWLQVVLFPSYWPHAIMKMIHCCRGKRSRNKDQIKTDQNLIEQSVVSNVRVGSLSSSSEVRDAAGSSKSSLNSGQENNKKDKQEVDKYGWQPLAAILNRLFAIVHLLGILILFFCLVYPIIIFSG